MYILHAIKRKYTMYTYKEQYDVDVESCLATSNRRYGHWIKQLRYQWDMKGALSVDAICIYTYMYTYIYIWYIYIYDIYMHNVLPMK